ncbi:ammonium transporter [Kiritimatiella glycovorans]|uniref:Ammonium transporter n=1 Tax=Kiritimatiella glycovorans TaxID=1307763 RepID=A0A0G3EEH1_9BACT|nr:ammonium transporter [Kiritimatiella glycovorans]AKJ64748.1 Ammonia transporter [Kiritimatiella glycovorans]
MRMNRRVLGLGALVTAFAAAAHAGEGGDAADAALFTANNVWMMVSTFLVFMMHLGFASVESGLTRAKNTVNILFKNTAIISIGLLTYTVIGFNLMYPGESWFWNGVLGCSGLGLVMPANGLGVEYAGGGYTYWTDFLFQGMFAATAATIVSGAVAERIRLGPFMIFSILYVMFVYPAVGSWKWGGGWLAERGFHDFAGSTLVHSVGGWAALAGIMLLGPRAGKYVNGQVKPIMGHNMPLLTIGVFLLWLGWFGFNGGSVLSGNPGEVSYVLVTTSLAAAAGIAGAIGCSWTVQHKPDVSMVLNGCLAGLVGITAGADVVGVLPAILIGLACGVVAVLSVIGIDHLHLDDPVGATTVHLVCGVLGTLFAGAFAHGHTTTAMGTELGYTISFGTQFLGVISYAVVCFPMAWLIFYGLKKTVGIRVSLEEELKGLDIGEHAMDAYGGFQIFSTM